jgi:hypothetical protein
MQPAQNRERLRDFADASLLVLVEPEQITALKEQG